MRVLAHDDPALEPFKDTVSRYTDLAKMLGLAYWVFIADSNPVGVVTVGKEPIQLLTPIGTPIALIKIINFNQPQEVLSEFASKALTLSKEKGATFTFTTFPAKYDELGKQFENLGFKELANAYHMVCSLEKPIKFSSTLQFEKVPREKVNQFIELAVKCMSHSPDLVLNIVLENLQEVPDELLDIWYNLEQLYIVYHSREVVGILDLNPKEGTISNIGVAPKYRSRGFGRQIMLFGLQNLMENGVEKAWLRVHVDNKGAIHLYKSLGFTITEQHRTFSWPKAPE